MNWTSDGFMISGMIGMDEGGCLLRRPTDYYASQLYTCLTVGLSNVDLKRVKVYINVKVQINGLMQAQLQ